QDAPAARAEEEATRAEAWIKFEPVKREDPPTLVDFKFTPAGEETLIDGKKVLVVSQKTVKLTGKIRSKNIIAEAEWGYIDQGWEKVKGEPDYERPIDADFTLKVPDKIVGVKLRAKSKNSDYAGAEI